MRLVTYEQQTSAGETHQITVRFERANRPADVKILASELDFTSLARLGKKPCRGNALLGQPITQLFCLA